MIVRRLIVEGFDMAENLGKYGFEDYDRIMDVYEKAKNLFRDYYVSSLERMKTDVYDKYKFAVLVSDEDDQVESERTITALIAIIDNMKSIKPENLGYNNLIYYDWVHNGSYFDLIRTNKPEEKTFEDVRKDLESTDLETFLKAEVSGKIGAARDRKGISQRELSKLSGVPQKTISRIESMIDIPKLVTLYKL